MFEPPKGLQPLLLTWTDGNLRDLPWRRTRDPWQVLVAETMLQQTQVTRVVDRWTQFVDRYPDPSTCAEASAADLLREWVGLGYNRRALLLHRAAIAIQHDHGGAVPGDLERLLALPGVGAYTARAVLAFAFEIEAAPVDTNIGRVLARIAGERLSAKTAQQLADSLVPANDSWRWNQGLMELGALVCQKREPNCGSCPLRDQCVWQGSGADPAEGSASVSRPQDRFEGSDRQLRGQVINALRVRWRTTAEMAPLVAPDDPARRARIIDGLVEDGLIEREGDLLRLVGDQLGPVSESRSASIA
jgi:A/G-specific adenine glycosylase